MSVETGGGIPERVLRKLDALQRQSESVTDTGGTARARALAHLSSSGYITAKQETEEVYPLGRSWNCGCGLFGISEPTCPRGCKRPASK